MLLLLLEGNTSKTSSFFLITPTTFTHLNDKKEQDHEGNNTKNHKSPTHTREDKREQHYNRKKKQ
jgi:hypothetical protein